MQALPFSLSIIVPVLNEAELLDEFLRHLRNAAPSGEIIVVDGGSADETVQIARGVADVVISARRGRAVQMNAGASAARGEVLWFLHADLRLPTNATPLIAQALFQPDVIGGCFHLRFPRRPVIYRVSDSLGNLGVWLFGFALGDHAIFCRRNGFEQIGGYRDIPILEDAEFYRGLHRLGRMMQLPAEVRCSPRAYERYGPHRTTAVYFLILLLYICGVPIRTLYRIYCRFRGQRIAPFADEPLTAATQR